MAGVNFPRFQAFDYGAAVKTRQDLEYGEMRNEVTGMEMQAQKDVMANRKKAQEIRDQMESTPDQIDAMEAQNLYDEAAQLRSSWIDSQVAGVKMLEVQREGVNADNWDQWRYDLLQAGAVIPEMLPAEYPGDAWFRDKSNEMKNKISVQTRRWAEQGVVFSQDFISNEYGDIDWTGEPYKDPTKQPGGKGGKPWQMTSGDTNSIRGAAAELYGSMWDPQTQRFSGLSKTQSADALSIAEAAAKIYNANQGRIPHSVAVSRAARQKGINIESLRVPGGGNDPFGIRQ